MSTSPSPNIMFRVPLLFPNSLVLLLDGTGPQRASSRGALGSLCNPTATQPWARDATILTPS